ncbi:MAG: MBL fold metallo-hydrolase, partial [Bermanella sp.]
MINTLDLGWGITQLDTAFQRPNMAACYIMQDAGEVAIIETGTKDTVPLIFACLQQLGLKPEQVKYIIPTHVHLDHAGGVGRLMQQLPNATLVVHEKGARHMIDPSKLQAGASAVYGEAEFNKTYGDLLPVAKERIISPLDNEQLTLGQRTLTFLDTPGHARHHFCVYDEVSQGFFSGDTFGLAYQELTNENGAFLMVTTTPVQFDPDALKNSIDKLMAMQPQRMFLTHYGVLENP